MKKINIIRKTQEFDKLIKNRRHYSNRYFVIYVMKKSETYHRFGISIPKKVGNSVARNKIKRQLKSIIDQNKTINLDLDYVIIVRKDINDLDYKEMSKNLETLLAKIDGAWKSEKN